jgi:hypothetical protein
MISDQESSSGDDIPAKAPNKDVDEDGSEDDEPGDDE